MLAIRPGRLDGPGMGRAVRSLSRRAGRLMSDETVDSEAASPRLLEIWLPIAIVVLDQITKALVRSMVPLSSSVEVVPGFVNFTHVQNTGAAFGFLNAADFPFKTVAIAVIALGAIVWVGVYAAGLPRHHLVARLGLACIMGGAAGNLLDRVLIGSVVDFVDVY